MHQKGAVKDFPKDHPFDDLLGREKSEFYARKEHRKVGIFLHVSLCLFNAEKATNKKVSLLYVLFFNPREQNNDS